MLVVVKTRLTSVFYTICCMDQMHFDLTTFRRCCSQLQPHHICGSCWHAAYH